MNWKRTLVFLLVIFAAVTVFGVRGIVSLAQEIPADATDPVNSDDLMSQGKIRTCLKAEFAGDAPHGNPPIQATTYHLTGFCGSPSGCTCVWNQGTNGATARMEGECNDFKDQFNCKVSKEELKARRSSKDKQVAKEANRCTSCGHTAADARQPELVNLQPITEACNIIAVNNASSGVPSAEPTVENQVLGATSVLPYGPVDITVQENTARHTDSGFYAEGDLASTVTDLGTGEAPTGDSKTEQLGTLEFQKEDFTAPDMETKCATISWDPYGRVFDAQTLEPISDSEVTLIDAISNQPVIQQFDDNFDITGNDAVFNILVEKEGNYKLDADGHVTDHQFVSNPSINPLWSKIYSDLYIKDKTFYEKPRVATHHDIALASTNGPYHGAVAVLLGYTLQSTNIGDNLVYTGRVTYPFAKVCLKNDATGQIVGKCVNANNIGKFTIAVPKSQVPQTRLQVIASKVNLTDPNLYKNNGPVETLNVGSSVTIDDPIKYYFEPVLSHLEGYVYSEDGKIIPNAEVAIILKRDDKTYYKTNADDSGFFTVYSNNLPFLEYYLQFTDPSTGKKIIQTTSDFASTNKDYLNGKNINLVAAQKNNQPFINQQTGKLNQIPDDYNPSNNKTEATNKVTSPIKMELLVVVFMLVVLMVGAVGIAVYIKRQNKFIS